MLGKGFALVVLIVTSSCALLWIYNALSESQNNPERALWLQMSRRSAMEFSINSLWNGEPIDHPPMKLTIGKHNNDSLRVVVEGKLFNDPPSPSNPPGPTDVLWDYEVVEAFFLNSQEETYLEVEFGPHGHHIVLLLQGKRNIIKKLLPMEYTTVISPDKTSWQGVAIIPVDYLPPRVDKFNAFAIHGTDPNRFYEQLYPQKAPLTQPDFHRLGDFRSIDMSPILPTNQERAYSSVWKENMTPKS